MADIVAANVTQAVNKRVKLEDGRMMNNVTITFGDGALTYPAGGVPFTKAGVGCPVNLDSLVLEDLGGSAYVYQVDKANSKLRIFQSAAAAAHAHAILLKDGAVADGAGARVNAEANKIGANAGGDITIAAGGANGGIVAGGAIAAGGLTEITGVAIAAQTILAISIGY